jgi:hypothetical protein
MRLVAGAVLLPMAILLLLGVAALLTAMQDAAGAAVLGRIALGLAVLWVFTLLALLLALAAKSLADDDRTPPLH